MSYAEPVYCATCGGELEHYTRDGIAFEVCDRCGERPVLVRRSVALQPETGAGRQRGPRGPRGQRGGTVDAE